MGSGVRGLGGLGGLGVWGGLETERFCFNFWFKMLGCGSFRFDVQHGLGKIMLVAGLGDGLKPR